MLRSLFVYILFLVVSFFSLVQAAPTSDLSDRAKLRIEQSIDTLVTKNISTLTSERIQILITKIDNLLMTARMKAPTRYAFEYLKIVITDLLVPVSISKTSPVQSITTPTSGTSVSIYAPVTLKNLTYTRGPKTILAGKESTPIAKYELTATLEDFTLNSFYLSTSQGDFGKYIQSVQIYTAEGKLLAKATPQDNLVRFPNVDIQLAQGTTYLYVTITPNAIGFNQAGKAGFSTACTFYIEKATGKTSQEEIKPSMLSTLSDTFIVQAGTFTQAGLYTSFLGNTTDTLLNNGFSRAAILGLGVESNATTSQGQSLKTILQTVTLQISDATQNKITGISLKNINGSQSVEGVIAGNTVTFYLTTLPVEERTIESNDVAGFLITTQSALSPSQTESISLTLENSGITYTTNEDNTIYTGLGKTNAFDSSVSLRE